METERTAANDPNPHQVTLRRGWRLGGETFLSRLLDQLEGKPSESHPARERIEATEAKAERIIEAGLREIGWTEDDLRTRRKCAPEKVRLAERLRSETTLSLKKVAERLNMGTWTNTSNLLCKARGFQS